MKEGEREAGRKAGRGTGREGGRERGREGGREGRGKSELAKDVCARKTAYGNACFCTCA